MKLPRSLIIGDSEWNVVFKRKIPSAGKGETLGLCDPSNQTIYLKKGMKSEELLDTYLHEIFHIFEDTYGRDVPHKWIYFLATKLAKTIVDNFGVTFTE